MLERHILALSSDPVYHVLDFYNVYHPEIKGAILRVKFMFGI